MPFCEECGNPISEQAKFCSYCGEKRHVQSSVPNLALMNNSACRCYNDEKKAGDLEIQSKTSEEQCSVDEKKAGELEMQSETDTIRQKPVDIVVAENNGLIRPITKEPSTPSPALKFVVGIIAVIITYLGIVGFLPAAPPKAADIVLTGETYSELLRMAKKNRLFVDEKLKGKIVEVHGNFFIENKRNVMHGPIQILEGTKDQTLEGSLKVWAAFENVEEIEKKFMLRPRDLLSVRGEYSTIHEDSNDRNSFTLVLKDAKYITRSIKPLAEETGTIAFSQSDISDLFSKQGFDRIGTVQRYNKAKIRYSGTVREIHETSLTLADIKGGTFVYKVLCYDMKREELLALRINQVVIIEGELDSSDGQVVVGYIDKEKVKKNPFAYFLREYIGHGISLKNAKVVH